MSNILVRWSSGRSLGDIACFSIFLTEEQKSKKHDSTEVKEEKIVPSDFIWGRTDVNRNMSGKLYPRTRQLYQLDHGDCSKGFGTYFSVADKIARLPEHFPFRGIFSMAGG